MAWTCWVSSARAAESCRFVSILRTCRERSYSLKERITSSAFSGLGYRIATRLISSEAMIGMFEWVVELIEVVEGGWFISRGEDEKLNWIGYPLPVITVRSLINIQITTGYWYPKILYVHLCTPVVLRIYNPLYNLGCMVHSEVQ